MNFESLANELILDLFEYFDGFDILRIFYGLNARLNQLCYHFRLYRFNFRSISKHNFDRICQEYLPLIINQVISFHFSDDDETPTLPELFLCRGFLLNQFTHLKSLSLYSIHSLDLLNQMINQCRSLRFLKHLNIIKFNIDYEQDKTVSLMNDIWSLPLTQCRFENFYSGGQCFFSIQVISTSMNYLFIDQIYCDLNVLYHLFEHTPNLRHLSISSDYSTDDESLHTMTSSIRSLKLAFEGSIISMINLFQNLPNLCYLTLKTSDLYLNGNEWEKIFVDYLPNIKKFRLRMNFQFSDDYNKDEQIEQLLETFQTDFWIKQHQWFVRCDWNPFDSFNRIYLYTLPYDFGDFFYFDTIQSRSTYPSISKDFSYDRVNILRQSFSENLPIESINYLSPRFYKIYDLKISIPFSQNFSSCIASLDQLNSLDVTICDDSSYSQLQLLLDRAPHLYSLTLRSAGNIQISLLELSNASIRRLDLMTKSTYRLQYFNHNECIKILAQSSIGKQCEVLLISVENRTIICELIQIMSNLRSITFQCKEDKCKYRESLSTNDEVLHWLVEHLSSEFMIVRDKRQISKIHIWIK
jgi:hypothetical protein